MKQWMKQGMCLLLALSMLLAMTACGSGAKAATMQLKRAEGTVAVSDDGGKDVPLLEDLELYSGYGVNTRAESFAWINLDDVKLTKMDQDSEIAIQKDGKDLEIVLNAGSLFFNVTEPLKDDETMNIRTSTMVVGIRGTCGWVEAADESHMSVYLLEGKVECTVGEQPPVTVMAGEAGHMDETAGTVAVEPFTRGAIPAFVSGELDGISLENIPEDPLADALAQYRVILSQASTYFGESEYDASQITSTSYQYTLARMQPESQVPALILRQEIFGEYLGDFGETKVFQYDPDSHTVRTPDGTISDGVAGAGGYRGGLTLAASGTGILETSWSSGTGMGVIVLVTLQGEALQRDTLFDGFLFDEPMAIDTIGSLPITWYDVTDESGLDGWTPSETGGETANEPDDSETALPTDGDRIVFRGTLGAYRYSEVLTLQGQADPNPGSDMGETYYLIVLDTPQTMGLRSSDPTAGLREGSVQLVDVTGCAGIDQYAGQNLAFSIDPNSTYWPSDTSLPLGQPRTGDVHVLS